MSKEQPQLDRSIRICRSIVHTFRFHMVSVVPYPILFSFFDISSPTNLNAIFKIHVESLRRCVSIHSPATTTDGWKHWCTKWTKSTIFISWFNRILSTATQAYIFAAAAPATAVVLFVRFLIISCTTWYRVRFNTRYC